MSRNPDATRPRKPRRQAKSQDELTEDMKKALADFIKNAKKADWKRLLKRGNYEFYKNVREPA